METAAWRFWRFWSKRSRYRPAELEEDLNKLRSTYRDEGFLDVIIDKNSVKIMPQGKSYLDIVINIDAGKRSYFGEIKLKQI